MNKKFYRDKSVLIPGGAGFIGSGLARRLASLGAKVTVVDPFDKLCGGNMFNLKTVRPRINLSKYRVEDFLVKNDVRRYDVIFNCAGLANHHAGQADIGADYRINCGSGLAILEELARRRADARLVSIGSRSQYGKAVNKAVDESDPMNPLDVQAAHKVLLEHYHRLFSETYGLSSAYVRLTNTYGPGQRLKGEGIGLLGEMVKAAILGEDIIVFGSLSRIKDVIFAEDAVGAILSLGESDDRGFSVYNLGGGRCTMRQLIEPFKKRAETAVRVIPFPDKIRRMDTGDVVLKSDSIMKKTGWKPRFSIDDGIAITLEYYLRNKRRYL